MQATSDAAPLFGSSLASAPSSQKILQKSISNIFVPSWCNHYLQLNYWCGDLVNHLNFALTNSNGN